MEVIELTNVYRFDDDDDEVFDHTHVIMRDKNEENYFHGRSPTQINWDCPFNHEDIEWLDAPGIEKIRRVTVFPPYAPTFPLTIAPKRLVANAFIKRPRLSGFLTEDVLEGPGPRQQLQHELSVYEALTRRPHPNIAEYYGCVIERRRIVGLCVRRYALTLKDMVESGIPFDKQACAQGIEDGMRHLHALGLVHGNLSPKHIMVDMNGDNPVIIDLAHCQNEGAEPFKSAISACRWTDPAQKDRPVCRENDRFSLARVKEFMLEGSPRRKPRTAEGCV